MPTSKVLIAWHSRTGTAQALAEAAARGAGSHAQLMPASEVEPHHFLDAGGYLFACPENLATMSGAMKEMFDRCYYPVLGKIEGRPFATIIAAGSDGEGAQRQIDRIAQGWRLKRVADPWIIITDAQTPEAIAAQKTVNGRDLKAAMELGQAMSEGLGAGIF